MPKETKPYRGYEPYDGKQQIALPMVCRDCHQVAAMQIMPGLRTEVVCPRCNHSGMRLDPESWLARQIVALAMEGLGITHEEGGR